MRSSHPLAVGDARSLEQPGGESPHMEGTHAQGDCALETIQ